MGRKGEGTGNGVPPVHPLNEIYANFVYFAVLGIFKNFPIKCSILKYQIKSLHYMSSMMWFDIYSPFLPSKGV